MTLFLLIRHALTDVTGKRLSGSLPGFHLSAEGRHQAERLAERLEPIRLTAIYSSPLERCVETAEAVARRRNLQVRRLPDLDEVGYGQWSGRSLAQLARTALWKRLQQAPSSVRFPGGETLSEVQGRTAAALEGIASRSPRGVIAVVSHADVIRLLLAHFAGIHIDLFQRLTVSPASVSALVLGDRIPRILRVNDTGSVADLAAAAERIAARTAAMASPDGGRTKARTSRGTRRRT
ncbi:MAG: histidine phosphatase family protein [Actinomycetota bacterium]|nr:histidine phosphatase family protein [Actinomycetota bacterium]